jgi:hypothetical protein
MVASPKRKPLKPFEAGRTGGDLSPYQDRTGDRKAVAFAVISSG